MKGEPQIIDALNEILTAELTAINQYFIHSRMCANWGYKKLAEKNQWDANFKSAAETRRFMESEYNELKEVMTFLGLAK